MRSICSVSHLLQATLPPEAAAILDIHLQAQQALLSTDTPASLPLLVTLAMASKQGGRPGTLLTLPMPPDSDLVALLLPCPI